MIEALRQEHRNIESLLRVLESAFGTKRTNRNVCPFVRFWR